MRLTRFRGHRPKGGYDVQTGSPRIYRDLLEDHQERISGKRVIRLMQEDGLKARVRKRFKCRNTAR